jgi:cytochrome c-type biogenesis protein CcmH
MTRKPALAAVLWLLAAAVPFAAHAADAIPTESDPVAQSRTVKLTEKLRCLVCQNQTIADSSAELAVDLRRQVREQVAAGKTDQQIIDYMVARYGDFVLYEPPLRATTLLLWGGPALLLILGAVVLLRILKQRRELPEPEQLSPEERERAKRLLEGKEDKDSK